ncbi:beta-lactamase [Ilyonectria robusta]|uniref:beta-lactamase n=1 Tax=Ilyonectria robusta TaxID=1079257 RepID=UPI001E8D2B72|nr:beta-lactamase [Ilyonectria robusta]KAH8652006.1 beta-lactamase [Ilyonectria robusta]
MQAMESSFQVACDDGNIPGAVLVATNRDGSFDYAKAFGFRSLEGDVKPRCEVDTIMGLFSATKFVTTIAALQLVEQGLVSLDDDTSDLIPELARLPILASMEGGKAELRTRRNPITLRHLLTHSSGLAYTFMSATLREYQESVGKPAFAPPRGVVESYNTPLVFEPGTSWTYSTGLDWVGLLISRVSKLSLEEYFQKNIMARLDIKDITFWVDKHPELKDRLASLSIRDQSSTEVSAGKAIHYKGPNMMMAVQEEFGGQGLYASMSSYLKILKSILVNDEQLLKKETTAIMFEPQLTAESREALQAVYQNQPSTGPCSIGSFRPDIQYNWGLGGLLSMEDGDWRKKGCMNWSGMPNLLWFIDREAGLCGVYGGQLMPAGDVKVKEMINLFEKTMYGLGERKSSL